MSEWDWRGCGREGLPTLATENCDARDESRQHYANIRIQEFQRFHFERGRAIPFEVLLYAFVGFGIEYDQGARLCDLEESAA